jgi:hypothetical protein
MLSGTFVLSLTNSDVSMRSRGRWKHQRPYIVMLAQLAVILAYLGYVDQAWLPVNEALSEVRRIEHVHTLLEAFQFATLIQVITRSPWLKRYVEELQARMIVTR